MKNLFVLLIIFVAATCAAEAQIASGGNYTLDQSGHCCGRRFKRKRAVYNRRHNRAGNRRSTLDKFIRRIDGGFWTAQPLAPTAASVSLGGQITTADGRGIHNVFVTLTTADGTMRTVSTAGFGYFTFDEVEAGQTVIINVRAKRFTFAQSTRILNVAEDSAAINFVANE